MEMIADLGLLLLGHGLYLLYSPVPKHKWPSFWGVFEAVRVRLGRSKAIPGLGGAGGGIRGIPFHTFFTPPGHLPGTARNKSQKTQFRLKMYFLVPAASRDTSRAFAMPGKGGHGNECTQDEIEQVRKAKM